jgi:hypothetical protein
MGLYLSQLRGPESVMAFHVSSVTLTLQPVVDTLARSYNLSSVEVDAQDSFHSIWVLVSRDPNALRLPQLAAVGHPVEVTKAMHLWTDDYSSLYETLHW